MFEQGSGNKGLAIKELLKKYGISPEETMAFGDQWNDLEMLKFVKYGYLMGMQKKN